MHQVGVAGEWGAEGFAGVGVPKPYVLSTLPETIAVSVRAERGTENPLPLDYLQRRTLHEDRAVQRAFVGSLREQLGSE